MAQVLGNTRLLPLALLVCAPVLASAAPSGVYRGEQGGVRFTREGAAIRGISEGGGPCNWARGEVLFEGHLEGSVLTGRLKVCQSGTGCAPRSYPVMAIHDPLENTVSGHVKPDGACQVTGMRDRVFVLRSSEDAERGNSAAQIAARRLTRKEAEAAERAFTQAGKHLASGQYAKAVEFYEKGLQSHDSNYAAYIQLGVARMKLNNPTGALDAYERAARFASKPEPVIHYNMACAHARLKDRDKAMEQLRLAVDHGFPNGQVMRRDPDLSALLGPDPEFNELVTRLIDKAPRRSN
jgi:predicted negative regulator of RcsB-dependent stress response